MTAIRQAGKFNENTTLIDIGMQDVHGITAVYLVQGEKKCLIDSGTHKDAPRLVKMLNELGAFPPDIIIATHPHWDHIQGIPWLRQQAALQGKQIEVLASPEAIPLMADASFNDIFHSGSHASIQDVTPVKDGDTIDLGGLTLRIYDIPGHCQGHIAILDEKNRNVFVGDALGDKIGDGLFLPPFMPPTWDPQAFVSSVEKLKQLPYETLCLTHFGCISGSEARTILDESVENCNRWWQWIEKNRDRLSDTGYLLRAMRAEINPIIPTIQPMTPMMSVALGLVTAAGTVLGNKTAILDKLFLGDILHWLGTGYRMYTEKHP